MTGKLIEDLFISASGTTVSYYSSAVPMGGDNGAMAELWITSLSGALGASGVRAFLEGSNDGINFDTPAIASTAAATTAPKWEKTTAASAVLPWAWLRHRWHCGLALGFGQRIHPHLPGGLSHVP